jgi:beta-phosphoglucomutase
MPPTQRHDHEPMGLLFDLDGVLWDTSPVHDRAFRAVCGEERLAPVEYGRLAGRPTAAAWQLILAENGRAVEDDVITGLTARKQALAREWLRDDPPLSTEIGLVAAVADAAVPIGLVTGSSPGTVAIFLSASGLPFGAVVTAGSVASGKPGPEPYLFAAEALDLAPGDCWVLEDSRQGLESGVAAGARTVHLAPSGPACAEPHAGVAGCVDTIDAFLRLAGVRVTT